MSKDDETYSGARLSPSRNVAFSIRLARQHFRAMPAARQQETVQRVRLLLRDERRRKQVQPSALWRQAKDVYGVDPLLLD